MKKKIELLGLFPSFDGLNPGGIEGSGCIAWDAVRRELNDRKSACYLLTYANGHGAAHKLAHTEFDAAYSKSEAIRLALSSGFAPRSFLVWHVGLLKLLPFFRAAHANRVLFLHGVESWKRLDPLTERMLRRIRLFLSNSDVTWSRFLAYHPEFSNVRQRTVPLGIGDPFDTELPLPDPRPTALMLGRMARVENYKGHREIIEAWPSVLQVRPDAKLFIVGEGDLRSELEGLVRARGISESVRFWGRVSDEQKEELLLRSRCLALPSRGEGFGLVYLEAMRLGRPCLVSTLDAGREVVNPPEAGLAADPNKPEELASALCRLLSEGDQWGRWSLQARRRYEENYTAKHFTERLVAALFPNQE